MSQKRKAADAETGAAKKGRKGKAAADEDEAMSDVGGEDEEAVARPVQRKKAVRVLDDDEDEDENEGAGGDSAAPVPADDAAPAAGDE